MTKVVFRYSWVYDEIWKGFCKNYFGKRSKYPTEKHILNYINKVVEEWRVVGDQILKELCRVSGLKWCEKEIVCYVIGRGIEFSEPMTISIFRKPKDLFVDVLVHELIHRLFIQTCNVERTEKSWRYFFTKYRRYGFNTKIHIPLYAIHKHIYLKFFDESRTERDKRLCGDEYKKAWEIVERDGHEKIINEFKKRLL